MEFEGFCVDESHCDGCWRFGEKLRAMLTLGALLIRWVVNGSGCSYRAGFRGVCKPLIGQLHPNTCLLHILYERSRGELSLRFREQLGIVSILDIYTQPFPVKIQFHHHHIWETNRPLSSKCSQLPIMIACSLNPQLPPISWKCNHVATCTVPFPFRNPLPSLGNALM